MENLDYVVGLDIGTTKIVAIVAKVDAYNKIEISGLGKYESIGVKRGVVSNINSTVESIKKAVELAECTSGKNITKVVVGIAGQHIRSMQHSDYIIRNNLDEVINDDDVEDLCKQVYKLGLNEGERIIRVLPQEYKVDGESGIREPVGMYGARLEANFHVVSGKNLAIKNISDCVKKAGLELVDTVLEPMASSDAVLTEEEKEAGVALVDIGGGTTDLAIFKDGIIRHTAVIPFGGNIITADISEGCFIIQRYAEALKKRFGSALPELNKDNEIITIPGLKGRESKEVSKKSLSKIINARMIEIMGQVLSEMKNYGYQETKKSLIGGVVLTGGGSQLQHLKQLTEFVTGMDTRIGFPNEHLSGNTPSDIANPMYSTSVGLAINAIKNKKINDDLDTSKTAKNTLENEPDNIEENDVPQDPSSSSEKRKPSIIKNLWENFNNFLEKVDKQ